MESLHQMHDKAMEASRRHRVGLTTYEDMKRGWDDYLQEAERIWSQLDFKKSIAYGYQPNRESGNADTEHIVLEEDLDLGGIHRKQGDTLCRKVEEFDGLEALDLDRPPNCLQCLEIAQRILTLSDRKI